MNIAGLPIQENCKRQRNSCDSILQVRFFSERRGADNVHTKSVQTMDVRVSIHRQLYVYLCRYSRIL